MRPATTTRRPARVPRSPGSATVVATDDPQDFRLPGRWSRSRTGRHGDRDRCRDVRHVANSRTASPSGRRWRSGSLTAAALRPSARWTSPPRAPRTGRSGASRAVAASNARPKGRAARRSHRTCARRAAAGISDLVNINPAPSIPLRGIGFVSPQPFTFAWTDGTPTPSETNARTGLQHNGGAAAPTCSTLGTGFSFTVPADTTPRTLKVWVALNRAAGSSPRPSRTDPRRPSRTRTTSGSATSSAAVYTLTYSAASAEQTLTVSWVENADNCAAFRCDNVSIHAVALAGPGGGGGDADPPVLTGAVPTPTARRSASRASGTAGSQRAGQSFDRHVLLGEARVRGGHDESARHPIRARDERRRHRCIRRRRPAERRGRNARRRPRERLRAVELRRGRSQQHVLADGVRRSTPSDADDRNYLRTLRAGALVQGADPPEQPPRRHGCRTCRPTTTSSSSRTSRRSTTSSSAGAPAADGPNLALDDLNRAGAETPVDLFNTSQYNPSSWDPTNWKPDLNTNASSVPEFSPSECSPTECSASH